MKAIIFGAGSAGKRHSDLLKNHFGIGSVFYDPYYPPLPKVTNDFDIAVIASPPNVHLHNIRQAQSAGIDKIICEKPLTIPGVEIDIKLSDVCLTYNWRWHKDYKKQSIMPGSYGIKSEQFRASVPSWGIALDHLPHSIDLLLWLSGASEIEIKGVEISDFDVWVNGTLDGAGFSIIDRVWDRKPYHQRVSQFITPKGEISISTKTEDIQEMFVDMWRDILDWVQGIKPIPPYSMVDGLRVQEVLGMIYDRKK